MLYLRSITHFALHMLCFCIFCIFVMLNKLEVWFLDHNIHFVILNKLEVWFLDHNIHFALRYKKKQGQDQNRETKFV